MNTKGLAKHYGSLTPWERLPLILAASSRGDKEERARLGTSAPRHMYRIPDHFGLADGLQRLSHLYVIIQLDQAALFWQAAGLREQYALLPESEEHKVLEERLEELLGALAYAITVYADAWKRLNSELQAAPELLLKMLPGLTTVRQVEEEARAIAPTAEEMTAGLRSRGRESARPVTVESVLKDMREYLQGHVDWWESPPGASVFSQ
jgi:hypothetical protein